jgi:hypothetical protein
MILLYPARCFSMSFQSWAFCAERVFRSLIACSRAAILGSKAPAFNLRREAEVSGRSFDTDDAVVDAVDIAKDDVDEVANGAT